MAVNSDEPGRVRARKALAVTDLYALVAQAWELRSSPYFRDAVAAIVDAYDRAPLTFFEECEQRRARNAKLIRVLRETDPQRILHPWWEAA